MKVLSLAWIVIIFSLMGLALIIMFDREHRHRPLMLITLGSLMLLILLLLVFYGCPSA